MRKQTQKLFALLLLVCLFVGMIPAAMAAVPATLYLKPSSNWKVDGARFAAYFFNGGGGTGWASMTDSDGDGYYEVSVPSGMTSVIFCRMNGGASDNNWNNKWNQTEDLTIPTDGKNCATIREGAWDGFNEGDHIASWSTYGNGPIVTNPPETSNPSNPSDPTPSNPVNPSNPSGEVDSIQEGSTLHCWNWSFASIEQNMAKIAEQGFTAIQTSPIQQCKEGTVGKGMKSHWWLYYQPANFHIDTNASSALGTRDQFKKMCDTAHQYGIKVIVDVVANHLGNKTGNDLADTLDPDIKNDSSCWHNIKVNTTNYNDRYDITQHCMAGLPDLNTGNKKIQDYALGFLKECIDSGADGFRFDGAKHIETPEDGSCASNFWPYVINGATDYAKSTRGIDLYCYGEVLDAPGGGLSITAYTKHMSVTDNSWGNSLRNAINGNNAGGYNPSYHKNASANKLVVWAESHDTYANDSHESTYVSVDKINKTWALIAARADVMGLYFARPANFDTQKLGEGTVTGWANKEVKAVNEFHNAFVGTTEYIANENGIAYCERGNAGVVLVCPNGGRSVDVKANKMADGTYIDTITGSTFTVSGGRIRGQIGSTGIAVVWSGKTGCDHSWKAATCTAAKTCSKCGETEGAALGHNYSNATCSEAKKCTRCGKTEGAALGHNYSDATCDVPATCTRCGATNGTALGHNWTEGNCTTPATCTRCGATNGTAGHSWTEATCSAPKTCSKCGATEGTALGHKWSEATCTTPATCTVCGATNGTYGHLFNGGYCMWCGEEDPNYNNPIVAPVVDVTSATLSFEDEILVNLYYTISDTTHVVEHGVLMFINNPGQADFAAADDVYIGSAANGEYIATTDGIAAKEMGDDRYYCVYSKLDNGEYVYSRLVQYSPKKYAINMLAKASTSAKQKVLCVAMLNYGAAAQTYFNYRADDLMNAGLTAEQQAMVAPYNSTLFKGMVNVDPSKTGAFANYVGFSKRSVTVSFEGALAINYYFTPSNTVKGDMTLYVWTPEDYAAASQLTAENASDVITMAAQDNGSYWGQVSGIAAKMLDETYYVAGVYTDADGNTYCTGVLAYSLSKYCINNANGKMGALAQATAMYGYYAAQYFAN